MIAIDRDAAAHHYPPELFELLVECIPRLIRGKQGVINFFHGASVPRRLIADVAQQVQVDRHGITKFEIVRTALERLNDAGEAAWALRARREIIRRVTEWEDFRSCWPEERAEAENLVGRVRGLVNVKDSFTRIAQREARQAEQRAAERRAHAEEVRLKKKALADVRADLGALFSETDAHKRGKDLEGVLNRYFDASGILIEEAFTLVKAGDGVIEQIDGVIRLDGPCLVEMKWLAEPVGTNDSAQHLVRVHHRPQGRGILISARGFTGPAVEQHREALVMGAIVTLCGLDELVRLLEQEGDLREFLQAKMDAAFTHKNPNHRPLD